MATIGPGWEVKPEVIRMEGTGEPGAGHQVCMNDGFRHVDVHVSELMKKRRRISPRDISFMDHCFQRN